MIPIDDYCLLKKATFQIGIAKKALVLKIKFTFRFKHEKTFIF